MSNTLRRPLDSFKTDDITRRLVSRLIYYRRSLNMTQFELAAKTHISLRNYQRIESGEIIPKVDVLYNLANALNVDLEEFFIDHKNSSTNYLISLDHVQCDMISNVFAMDLNSLKSLILRPEVQKLINDNQQDVICDRNHVRENGFKELFISTFDQTYFSNEYVNMFGKNIFCHCSDTNKHRNLMSKFWEYIISSSQNCFICYCECTNNPTKKRIFTLTHLSSRKYSNPVMTGVTCDLSLNPAVEECFQKIKKEI